MNIVICETFKKESGVCLRMVVPPLPSNFIFEKSLIILESTFIFAVLEKHVGVKISEEDI